MHIRRAFTPLAAFVLLLSACVPALRAPDPPQPLPSPSGSWSMKLTQSGGFAGVLLSVEVTSDGRLTAQNGRTGKLVTQDLPAGSLDELARLYAASTLVTPPALGRSCADCFLYHLELTSAGRSLVLDLDDTSLSDSGLAGLIAQLQQLRDQALRAAP